MKGVMGKTALYLCAMCILSACATTQAGNSEAQKQGSQTTGVTKTGADARLESLSREELAKKIPAPKPISAPTS